MDLKTTIRTIYDQSPCADGFGKLLTTLFDRPEYSDDESPNIARQFAALTPEQQDAPVTFLQVLDSNGFNDAVWCLRCWEYRDWCLLAVAWAESVQHLSTDPRVTECNAAVHRWYAGEISDAELDAARAEAAKAAKAAWVAKAAKAARAAEAAAWAAAAADAAEAAEAAVAAGAAARVAQQDLNEKLTREFLAKGAE